MPLPPSAHLPGQIGGYVKFCKNFFQSSKKYYLTVLEVNFFEGEVRTLQNVLRSFSFFAPSLSELDDLLDHYLPASGSDRGAC